VVLVLVVGAFVVVAFVLVTVPVAAVVPVEPLSCAIGSSAPGFVTVDLDDDVLAMAKAVGDVSGCAPSARGGLLPVSDRGESGVRRVLALPFLGEASPCFIGALGWPASACNIVDVTPCNVRGNFAAAPLPDGLAISDAPDPSGLARWSLGMTDCARVLTAGVGAKIAVVAVVAVVVLVAVVAVVAVVLDTLDAAVTIAGGTSNGV
jgi:hypothetical protein